MDADLILEQAYKDILYRKKDTPKEFHFYDTNICDLQCIITFDSPINFRLVCCLPNSHHHIKTIGHFTSDNHSLITQGVIIVDYEVYMENKLSKDTLMKLFMAEISVQYWDEQHYGYKSYDFRKIIREITIDNIIKDEE